MAFTSRPRRNQTANPMSIGESMKGNSNPMSILYNSGNSLSRFCNYSLCGGGMSRLPTPPRSLSPPLTKGVEAKVLKACQSGSPSCQNNTCWKLEITESPISSVVPDVGCLLCLSVLLTLRTFLRGDSASNSDK